MIQSQKLQTPKASVNQSSPTLEPSSGYKAPVKGSILLGRSFRAGEIQEV